MFYAQEKDFHLVIVGLGRVADKHLKAALDLPKQIKHLSLVDPNQAAGFKLLAKYKHLFNKSAFAQITLDPDLKSCLDRQELKEALADKRVIVAITTPSHLHFSLAKLALEKGAHCLIEKPVTLRLQEAKALKDLAKKQALKIAIGHIYRYMPYVAELKSALAAGLIGEIISGSLELVWGHDQAYYDQAAWRGKYQSDGGVLLNQSIHALDLLFFLTGSQLDSASCYLAQLNHVMEAEDYAQACLLDTAKRPFNLIATTAALKQTKFACFKLLGQAGSVELSINNGKPHLKIIDKDGKSQTLKFLFKNWRQTSLHKYSWLAQLKNPHFLIYADLITAICNDQSPLADIDSGILALEAILTLYQAALAKQATNFVSTQDALASPDAMSNFFKA